MKKLLNYFLFKMGYTSIDQSDLRNLSNNKTEDLYALQVAVLRDLSFKRNLPDDCKDADHNDKIQSLYGWKVMLDGCILDAQNRESEQWVKMQMDEILHPIN
jgi:hypothetical protein